MSESVRCQLAGNSASYAKGSLTRGDLREAIEVAVEKAKGILRSSLVEWRLLDVSRGYGGVVIASRLLVRIVASPPLR